MVATINEEILRMTDIIKKTVPTERIYLFGSYAYGAPKANSDYDVYVVLSNDSLSPHDAIRRIYHALSESGRRTPVDVLARYAENFYERSKLLTLERKVVNEGVLLYEQNRHHLRMA